MASRRNSARRPTVTVHIAHRDITQATADVGVITVHKSGNLNEGKLASAVFSRAGPGMQKDLNDNTAPGKIKLCHRTVISVDPHTLGTQFKCFKLVCLGGWEYDKGFDEDLRICVLDCLADSAQEKHKSIMIPALGMGGLRYPPEAVAVGMFYAIRDFSADQYNRATTSLTDVHICLYGDRAWKTQIFIKTFIGCVKGDITHYQPRRWWEILRSWFSTQPARQVRSNIIVRGPPNFTLENTDFHFKIGAIDSYFENDSARFRRWLEQQA